MVQKEKKRRGRPRAYDPDTALQAALETFWQRGFAETSLDHLRQATGMNRPSLYAAFGDKKAIFRLALERFREAMAERQRAALASGSDPVAGLRAFFRVALDVYTSQGARGCMVVSTAAVEAPEDEQMRAELKQTLGHIDKSILRWLRELQQGALISNEADIQHVAWQVSSTLLSLGVHARAGYGRRWLSQRVDKSAAAILSPLLSSR